jgi:hypothetical protein
MQDVLGNWTSCPDPVQKLQDILASKESIIAANQTRIERLESLHRLAQDSATKCEAELLSCHDALARSQVDNQQLTAEVERSRWRVPSPGCHIVLHLKQTELCAGCEDAPTLHASSVSS